MEEDVDESADNETGIDEVHFLIDYDDHSNLELAPSLNSTTTLNTQSNTSYRPHTYTAIASISGPQPYDNFSTLTKDYTSNSASRPFRALTSNLHSASTFITSGYNYDTNSNDASRSTSPLQPHDSFSYDSISTTKNHASPPTFEQEDPVSTSSSQSNIRYRSNSTMEEDLDDSAHTTTTPDALTTNTKLRKKLRQRAKQQEQRKIARLQKSNLNTHDKDEMS